MYTSSVYEYQRLAAVNPSIEVEISIEKVSADKAITDGNDNYSLEGAKYGVYSGEKLLTTITTGKDGKATAKIKMEPSEAKNITIKEIKSSPGYIVDDTIYKKDGSSGKISVAPVCINR